MICGFTTLHNKVLELSRKHNLEIRHDIICLNGEIVGIDIWIWPEYNEPYTIGNKIEHYSYVSISEALDGIKEIVNNLK